ncbi:DNA helicase UvrD [Candidatus Shapirobacteria bacterium RBG_13_44_7]|uniref:DNA helicase UvrD n=1 Tax=Candidatus Shapirobacteria bacterium RBG_13_44_7 TaxID=1802149 RepID=A0A1F7SJC1_9BACT|nr:MAG: DNA helicase UvrD [Candidatus Shapirobacteria bacterium RBG_13_44_7]
MELVVDLHVHSHYSRATSKDMDLEHLYQWGKIKGINIIGTGDFTHPKWFEEIQNKLEPAELGLFKLKDDLTQEQDKTLPENVKKNLIRFILTVEISNIYSKNGKVRKLHHLIIAPDFKTVSALNVRLSLIGNLKSDGRPILGLDSYELLKICLETNPDILFIPAHIWTPWFSLFGSRSGFDSLQEAFGNLSSQIFAIETGLSSDPFMNWRLSTLDHITITSNSDAHSPRNLGREATVLNCDLNYSEIIQAFKTNDQRLVGTVEFFPEEGKYHYDGHRSCGVCLSPSESEKLHNLCPKCGQPLVLGVDHRVADLDDRPHDFRPPHHKQVEYIIPLTEILAEIRQVKSSNNQKVATEYHQVISALGNEFFILRKLSLEEIKESGYPQLARALSKMRQGQIVVQPGYDGIYGVIKVLSENSQMSLL